MQGNPPSTLRRWRTPICSFSGFRRRTEMALHRDIYWVGRQWAVTGYGIQACNQKQRSKFDIEASHLWEDDMLASRRAETWVNTEDFDQALNVARKHFPEPSGKAALGEQSGSELKQ